MSWILGYFGQPSAEIKKQFNRIAKDPLHRIICEDFSFFAGGLPSTCHHVRHEPAEENGKKGYVITGIGLRLSENGAEILDQAGWSDQVPQFSSQKMEINGHYVILRYDDNQIEVMTDPLGFRTFYIMNRDRVTYFSTRSDWLAKITGCHSVDFKGMGSGWLFMNSFTYSSHIENIERIGPYGRLIINNEGFSCDYRRWMPDMTKKTENDFAGVLNAFMRPKPDLFDTIFFGLSGGLDSRLLLSLLNRDELNRLRIYVFGESGDPDVLIAKRICGTLKLHLCHYEASFESSDIWISRVKDYCASTQAVSPASAIVNLSFYEQLRGEKALMIDGGFGEIARRQYFNRLLHFGRKHLYGKQWPALVPFVSNHRAGIFNQETNAVMREAAKRHIDEYFSSYPVNESGGLEDAMDQLAIRTRFPNFNSPEQARLDSITLNYMPFAQTSILDIMSGIPVRIRSNGHMFKEIIKKRNSWLSGFPLVKGNTTYPFCFSQVPAFAWVRIKQKASMYHKATQIHRFYSLLSEWIRDITGSQSFKNYPYYDHTKIRNIVDGYYSGRLEFVNELDWWLAFECWRQSLHY